MTTPVNSAALPKRLGGAQVRDPSNPTVLDSAAVAGSDILILAAEEKPKPRRSRRIIKYSALAAAVLGAVYGIPAVGRYMAKHPSLSALGAMKEMVGNAFSNPRELVPEKLIPDFGESGRFFKNFFRPAGEEFVQGSDGGVFLGTHRLSPWEVYLLDRVPRLKNVKHYGQFMDKMKAYFQSNQAEHNARLVADALAVFEKIGSNSPLYNFLNRFGWIGATLVYPMFPTIIESKAALARAKVAPVETLAIPVRFSKQEIDAFALLASRAARMGVHISLEAGEDGSDTLSVKAPHEPALNEFTRYLLRDFPEEAKTFTRARDGA